MPQSFLSRRLQVINERVVGRLEDMLVDQLLGLLRDRHEGVECGEQGLRHEL